MDEFFGLRFIALQRRQRQFLVTGANCRQGNRPDKRQTTHLFLEFRLYPDGQIQPIVVAQLLYDLQGYVFQILMVDLSQQLECPLRFVLYQQSCGNH